MLDPWSSGLSSLVQYLYIPIPMTFKLVMDVDVLENVMSTRRYNLVGYYSQNVTLFFVKLS